MQLNNLSEKYMALFHTFITHFLDMTYSKYKVSSLIPFKNFKKKSVSTLCIAMWSLVNTPRVTNALIVCVL